MDARKLANNEAGDENHDRIFASEVIPAVQCWLDPKYSVCEELTADGVAGVLMRDFYHA